MRKILFSVFFIINFSALVAQINVKIKKSEFSTGNKGLSEAMKDIKYGDYFFDMHTQGSYQKALNYYLKAYLYNQDNAALNYKIGVCYIKSVTGYEALPYLEDAFTQNENIAEDIQFFLAIALQLNYKFDDAIKNYQSYLSTPNLSGFRKKEVKKRIEECKSGKKLVAKPVFAKITNLENINSPYKDYASLITADGSKMFFSSRRPNTTGGISEEDDQYFEDIYFSKKDSIFWSAPKNLRSLNTPGHDDVVGLSHDGNTLILYNDGDLYYSEQKNGNWTNPKSFPRVINSREIESSACFSLDDSILYFVRGKSIDPEKSNGDIYFSKLSPDGKWQEPVKLPSNINSPYDEDGLFMFADGKTLYFSSKGHNSMGGYDIFKTTINDDGSFSDPVNLGYPINTPDNDIYFVMEPNNIIGYYTSVKKDTKGYTDIYQVRFTGNLFLSSEDNLIAGIANPVSVSMPEDKILVVVKGVVLDENGNPIEAEIVLINNKTNEIISRTKSDPTNGEYALTMPAGKDYGVVINKDGFMFHSENFNLVATSQYEEIEKDIVLKNIETNKTTTLHNVFFDFGSATLKETSIPELNNVVAFLEQNNKMIVEISGHTDNVGTYDENMKLSKERADAVATYLIAKGINKERIKTVGYGYTKPVAPNDSPENRQKNRRVEFKILSFD
jgi:outer membrane protein OmpA-like peptidoglycan-associated protein/tetratricopeptide (TPR) repeat protein